MFKKQLRIDGKVFSNGYKFNGKRPTEYWLAFLKRFVLKNKKSSYKLLNLIHRTPIFLGIVLILFVHLLNNTFISLVIAGLVLFFVRRSVIFSRAKLAFIPVDAFHDLAKFIISIKGDINKDRFNMRLNCGAITNKINLLDPNKIGLKPRNKVIYKPYQLERYKASFVFKDGTICSVALKQVTLCVTTTKRRRSGKTKTKTKYKHKFFHMFTLKLNTKDYKVHNEGLRIMRTNRFDINVHTANGFGFIEVIAKVKTSIVLSELKQVSEHKQSFYNEIMTYLWDNKVITKYKIRKA